MNGERKTLTLLDKIMPKRTEDATQKMRQGDYLIIWRTNNDQRRSKTDIE